MVGRVSTVAVIRPWVGLVAEARRGRVLLGRRVAEVVRLRRVKDRRRILVALVVPRVKVVIVLLTVLRWPQTLVHARRSVERRATWCEVGRLPLRRIALVCVRVVARWRLGLRRTPEALWRWEPVDLGLRRRWVLWRDPLNLSRGVRVGSQCLLVSKHLLWRGSVTQRKLLCESLFKLPCFLRVCLEFLRRPRGLR